MKKMIKTKDDFKGLYIELPANISKKKFNKIKAKFERLGFSTFSLCYADGIEYHKYILYSLVHNSIGNWSTHRNATKEVSIKDFLKEEEEHYVIQVDNYNCIPNKYMVFYGTNLRDIKEDVERTAQGFSYGKPKKFDNAFEGMAWCKKNHNKIVSFECKGNELYNSVLYNKQTRSFRIWNKDEKMWVEFTTANSFLSNKKGWKNIREYRPTLTKIPLGEVIKKGLRFKFKDENWRKSPQGFILDSRGNSLKSSVLLENINTEVELIKNNDIYN